jgi:2-hydroxy-3-keto-5-methylthiopentenyl-1-phosphate phosphatase
MLVLCDFDGTITTEDVTNVLWDRYGIPNWRDVLLPPYRAGEATTLELMDRGWRVIDRSEADLMAVARERIGLRDGFGPFVDACRARGWPLHVVSCGLDWYLRGFLPADVAFTCYTAALEDGWRVRLPEACDLPAGADFKIHVMRSLAAHHPGVETVFVGDGRNDFPIAQTCDRVFAIRNSTLAHLCRSANVPVEEFESFETIQAALMPAAVRP